MPDGRWQIETGLIDWSRDDSGGLTTDTTMWGSSAIKYGVSSNFDVELWVTPLEAVSMHGGSLHEHASSVGDTVLRIKYEITKSDAPVQVALDPFVKIPTASRIIGNGKAEAGLMVPIEIALGKSPFTVTLDPEVDWLADETGAGHHEAYLDDRALAAMGLGPVSHRQAGLLGWLRRLPRQQGPAARRRGERRPQSGDAGRGALYRRVDAVLSLDGAGERFDVRLDGEIHPVGFGQLAHIAGGWMREALVDGGSERFGVADRHDCT